jgi:hypothetical protein
VLDWVMGEIDSYGIADDALGALFTLVASPAGLNQQAPPSPSQSESARAFDGIGFNQSGSE